MTAPKLFISYSWSNAEHEQWVIDLASELCESDRAAFAAVARPDRGRRSSLLLYPAQGEGNLRVITLNIPSKGHPTRAP